MKKFIKVFRKVKKNNKIKGLLFDTIQNEWYATLIDLFPPINQQERYSYYPFYK